MATLVPLVAVAACGDESGSLSPTESDMDSIARGAAVADLELTLSAEHDPAANSVAVTATARNLVRSVVQVPRIVFAWPSQLGAPDPLPPPPFECVVEPGIVDCTAPVILSAFNGAPDPRSELTFLLTAPVVASPAVNIVVEATATTEDLDLDNDEDPTNNTTSVTITMP